MPLRGMLETQRLATVADAIMSALPMIIVEMETGDIEYANAPAEKLFGYTVHGEMIDMNVRELVPHERRERHEAGRRAYTEAPYIRQVVGNMVLEGLSKSGTVFPVQIGLVPLVIGGKKMVLCLITPIHTPS